jgi:hypothetical protein
VGHGARFQQRGYAREAAKAVVSWLRSTGVTAVTAHIHPDNTPLRASRARSASHRHPRFETAKSWRKTVVSQIASNERWPAGHDSFDGAAPVMQSARFEELFAAYGSDIVAYCGRRALSATDAVDAASEVFLTAWRRLDQLPDGDAARAWLYATAQSPREPASVKPPSCRLAGPAGIGGDICRAGSTRAKPGGSTGASRRRRSHSRARGELGNVAVHGHVQRAGPDAPVFGAPANARPLREGLLPRSRG